MDRGGEAGSTGFGRPIGPVRAASTGPALPAQPAQPADSAGWSRFYRRPHAGPAGPRDPSGRPLAGSTVTGPRPPAPTTGLYPAAACGPFLRARSGGAARPKIPQPAFYYHTAVQVATVTLDYSGKRPAVHRHLVVLKVAEYARTCARSSLHNTVDTSAALRSVAARAHTETTPNHASAPPRKRKNVATQTQHQVTMLNCARGERVQERASSVHW